MSQLVKYCCVSSEQPRTSSVCSHLIRSSFKLAQSDSSCVRITRWSTERTLSFSLRRDTARQQYICTVSPVADKQMAIFIILLSNQQPENADQLSLPVVCGGGKCHETSITWSFRRRWTLARTEPVLSEFPHPTGTPTNYGAHIITCINKTGMHKCAHIAGEHTYGGHCVNLILWGERTSLYHT